MSDTQDSSRAGQYETELGRLLAEVLELLAGQRQALGAGNLRAVQDAMPQVTSLLSQAASWPVTPADAAIAGQVAQAHQGLLLSLAAGKEEVAANIRQMGQSQRLVRAYTKSKI